jgi:acyl-CoA thioesterase FadM
VQVIVEPKTGRAARIPAVLRAVLEAAKA